MSKRIKRILGLTALLCCIGTMQSAMASGLHVDSYSIYGSMNNAEYSDSYSAVTEAEQKSTLSIGDNYVVARIVNNTEATQQIMISAAIYAEDGSLEKISEYKIIEAQAQTEIFPRISIPIDESDNGKIIKVFVWDAGMEPIESNLKNVFSAKIGAFSYAELNEEEISLPAMFSDNMIIQRNQDIKLWGRLEGSADELNVMIVNPLTGEMLDNTKADITGKDWMATLGEHEYEGVNYSIIFEASKDGEIKARKTIDNIALGDVYLCAGQSNMEYEMLYHSWTDCREDLYKSYEVAKNESGGEIRDAKGSITPVNAVYSPKLVNSNIRIIENMNTDNIEENYTTDTDGWHCAEPKALEHFSATATYFGFDLEEKTGVPVGLIQSAMGGAGIETWAFNPTVDNEGNVLYSGSHGVLFKRQISAYTRGPIGLSGILWYQGCADADGKKMDMSAYTKTLEQMVNDWRAKFNQPNLPFMYVQLASFTGTDFSALREAQLNYRMSRNTNNEVSNVGMAVIVDNADGISDIHPRNKKEVGRRLSLLAEKMVYGTEVVAEGPLFDRAEVDAENGTITVYFEEESTGGGLVIDGDKLNGLTISTAARRVWVEPEYEISADKKSIILKAPEGSLATYPSVVQYGYYGVPTDANIRNSEGLIASPFRNYDDATPTVPDPIIASELEVSNVSPESITLNWGAEAEAAEVSHYEVIRNGEVIASVGCVPVTDKTVVAGEEYSYQIKVYNAEGAVLDESETKSVTVPEDVAYSVSVKDGAVSEKGISLIEDVQTASAPIDGTNTLVLGPKGTFSVDIPSFLSEKLANGAKLTYTYNAETIESTIDVTDGSGNILSGEFIGANGSPVNYWKQMTVPVYELTYNDADGSAELKITNTSGRTIYVREVNVKPMYEGETATIKALDNNTIELKYVGWFPKSEIGSLTEKKMNAFTWNNSSWTNIWINPLYMPAEAAEATFITTYYDTPDNDTTRLYAPTVGDLAPVTSRTGEWVTKVVNKDAFENVSPIKPSKYNDNYAVQLQNVSMGSSVNEIEIVGSKVSVPAEIEMLGGAVHRTMMDYDREIAKAVINTATENAKYISVANSSEAKLSVDSGYIPGTDNNVTVDITYVTEADAKLVYTNTQGTKSEITLAAGGREEEPKTKTIHIKDYVNTNGLSLVTGGSKLQLVRMRVTNNALSYSEIVPAATVDTTPMPEARIDVMHDDTATTDSQIGLMWISSGEAADDIKYYRVQRISNGTVEFETDGEVSDTKYVDKGSSQRPDYGPYETDYTKATSGRYNVSDMSSNTQLLSDAGITTRIYDTYEGIPLVSGGEYIYVVRGYNASGEIVAESAPTKVKTLERENTASIVFEGTPQAGLQGYNMSVSTVTGMTVGSYGGITGWTFTKGCDMNKSNLGLLLDDASGLTNSQEDTGYLVKITWGDKFWNALGAVRINLQRTANTLYNQTNFNDAKNFIAMDAGSGSESNKWITREIAYYGKNAHSLTVNDVMADIAINASFAGNYGRFFIKSIEITKWDGPEERPFEVNLPSMFTDNMMLQRDKEINIWGRIDGVPFTNGEYAETTVTAKLVDESGNEVTSGMAAASLTKMADWTVTLDDTVAYEEGKTYSLEIVARTTDNGTIKESEPVIINDIIVGDIYLCAGQSNMRYGPEYAAWTDYHADIESGMFDNNNIRIISNENTTVSDFWETDTVGWRKSSAQALDELKFSATASYFGKHLYDENGNVPIGLISSAVGGASIGTFLVDPVKDENGTQIYSGNSILYKRLIYPYTNGFNDEYGLGLSGIIWYQGEADATGTTMDLVTYTKCMEQMVIDYREAFNDDELPFMYVQLAPFYNVDYSPMREAQLNYMLGKNTNYGVPQNVGMAVITDNTDNIRDIHPRNKTEVGRRLSLWARKLVYKQDDVEYTGPIFKEAVPTEDGKGLTVTFEEYSVMNGLALGNDALVGMKIAGADMNFKEPDSYSISEDGKSITVMSSEVSEPLYVQYAYYQIPTDASIFNADGLPASAFRNYE